MEIKGNQVIASEDKYIHRKNTDVYFKKGFLLKDETIDSFEEVDSVPEPISEEKLAFIKSTKNKVKELLLDSFMKANINTLSLTNNEALAVKDYYPEWKEDVGLIKQGDKYNCDDNLWKCIKEHTAQANWKPSLQTVSLWKVIDEEHKGTLEDLIPYTPPMKIFVNKYYIQNEVKYKCIRDSGIALSHDLSTLVGIYVELIK